jgi:glycosyltransferase involved in cell wall biosynthesis
MDVTVALDARYWVAPDGSAWSKFGMARGFWERYLEVFDRVRVVARAARTARVQEDWQQVNTAQILFHGLPDYCGPSEFLLGYRRFRTAIRSAVPACGAVILRVASQVGNAMEAALHNTRPYALEVLGDPFDVFAPGVVDHPLRPLFRWYFTRKLRMQCRGASGVAYVTRQALQRRYPARALTACVSDVDLPDDALLPAPADRTPGSIGPFRLVTVGSLAQLYKGIDVLIDSVAYCVQAGLDVTATVVGDGRFRAELMRRAEARGVRSRITFTGQVSAGAPVRQILDSADLFVLPSRTEGLPRAMIEAMARGLPCIGSAVGGIPELLDAADLVTAGDACALAAKIREVLQDRERMAAMSRRNLGVAREYSNTVLAERRRQFLRHVREQTADWEKVHGAGGGR